VRTLSTALTSHVAGRSHTRATMLLLELRDGTSIGVTDHDKDLNYNILGSGIVSYQAGTGILTSDISLQAGLDADNYEVTGPIGELVTIEAVLGGRFNRARAYLFQVNWKQLSDGAIKLLAGNVSEARIEGGKFVFEIRSDADRFNQVVGRLIVNNCDADHGDARCGRVPESVVGTVTAVTDEMRFTVSYTGSYANDYFNAGTVEALTGDLAGTDEVEIFDWTVGGAIVLFAPLAERPAIGDTFTVKRGCGKARQDCIDRDNILNFRGFPEVPGSDQILRATIPGQGND
jgi:uncharacterized phage protein (TIGR02218 family)